ncbi:MAG: insulinase family protein [Actinomycetia bacterium]|nr:insulinase family protein [Actinomycetes bacterium]
MPKYFPASEQAAGSTRLLLKEGDGAIVKRTVLPNGLRVISEQVPGTRSVTVGVWAGVGSRDETPASAGAAHFLEHLLFKGTQTRSALEIAESMDAVGGDMNAFTSKEFTCFYTKSLARDLPLAVDVLLDITSDPLLASEDIEAERSVVIEEIAMHEDDAGDRAHEALQSGLLGRSKLALPILGTRESIAGMSTGVIRRFFKKHYQPQNLVVAAAGDVDHRELLRLVKRSTQKLDWAWGVTPEPSRGGGQRRRSVRAGVHVADWPGEQCTVSVGTAGLPALHEDRRTLDVFNTLVGGGMSSRLFQAIREDRGLAYSVYSFHTPYSDAGVWGVTAGCTPAKAEEVLAVTQAELERVVDQGVDATEVDRAKGHLAGSLVLSGEETAARMSALGRAEVATGQLFTLDEALMRIERVDTEGVIRVAKELLSQPRQAVVVGPIPDQDKAKRELSALGFA